MPRKDPDERRAYMEAYRARIASLQSDPAPTAAGQVHGSYGRYTQGCRCEKCRAAKALYMRERRAAARAVAQEHTRTAAEGRPGNGTAWAIGSTRYVATGIRHGTRYAYEEVGCRCRECTTARTSDDARRRRTS